LLNIKKHFTEQTSDLEINLPRIRSIVVSEITSRPSDALYSIDTLHFRQKRIKLPRASRGGGWLLLKTLFCEKMKRQYVYRYGT